MNHEAALQLQAWVDGELPAPVASKMADWVQRDPLAGALVTELRHARAALRAGEPECHVPASREFYWSGIEREIGRLETPPPTRPTEGPFGWMTRLLIPVGILAALALVLALPVLRDKFGSTKVWASEIESPLEDISSVTFRSESERMTVVWVNSR